MELMPAEIAAALPALYATEHEADPLCRAKLFTPDANYTLWATEFDPSQRLLFGYVRSGWDCELGYVSLDELESVRGPLGLPMERDLYFAPTRLSEVRKAAEVDAQSGWLFAVGY